MMDNLQGKVIQLLPTKRSHDSLMKTRLLFATLLLGYATFASADQITFSFVSNGGNVRNVQATMGGFTAGKTLNTSVTDATTGVIVPLAGDVTMSTGPASSYDVFPTTVVAMFNHGATDSVLIENPVTMMPILAGITGNDSVMVATHPGGTGAFLAAFQVTFVDPAILSMFNLKQVDPRGSAGLTFGQDQLAGTDLTAVAGGGTITITASAIPEPKTLLLLGGGILVAFMLRRGSKLC
jgi:hypothetical protein